MEDNVALVLEHHPLSSAERRERIDSGLRRMGLWEFRKALPKQLSGGMRQRVGIARALAVRPAMLLLDEPLSALDAQTRELLMDDFLELWRREKTTALYVTHNLDEALRLADRVCVLSRPPRPRPRTGRHRGAAGPPAGAVGPGPSGAGARTPVAPDEGRSPDGRPGDRPCLTA